MIYFQKEWAHDQEMVLSQGYVFGHIFLGQSHTPRQNFFRLPLPPASQGFMLNIEIINMATEMRTVATGYIPKTDTERRSLMEFRMQINISKSRGLFHYCGKPDII